MKTILYVGATLMIGASIYGFVDYQKTSHKKEFNDMYKEKEVTEPVVTVDEKTAVVTDKKEVTAKEEKTVTTVPAKKETKKMAKKKKRKLDTKLFSRGALDERYIKEEKVLPEPAKEKKEAVKTENKEQ
ncbi:MAG: hypothetical protein HOP10_09475 [Chitinophagaceae bacterium]|nr:hypothetical protein [Chitinophagaceae bacterium]